jgi:outer membrane protein OmpA-like peptidoglycan-associated protein
VVVPAAAAVSAPRAGSGTGLCMNAVKVTGAGAYFDVTGDTGVNEAVRLLDLALLQNMVQPPISAVARGGRYKTLNFRTLASGSLGEFTSPNYVDEWFPFTTNGMPTGDERNFASRLRGYFNIATAGLYTFALHGDDYARLRIGQDVILTVRDGLSELQTRQVQFVERGLYPFEILHFQNGSEAILELSRAPGAQPEGAQLTIDPTLYSLFTQSELFSAVVGQGSCRECASDPACLPSYFCRDSLCQPCILKDRCGPTCGPCTGMRPICHAPNEDPETARCVQCVVDADCPNNHSCTPTGDCKPNACKDDKECEPGKCERDAGICLPPACKLDTDCPLGQFCEKGECRMCPPGEEAVPRSPSEQDKIAPRCVRPGYRGGWAGCSVAPSQAQGQPPTGAALLLGLGLFVIGLAGLRARRRRTRGASAAAAGFFLLALAGEAAAQQAAPTNITLNTQTLQPAIGPNNILTVDGSRTPGKTSFFVNILPEYGLNPLRYVDLNSGQVLDDTVPHQLTLHGILGMGIGPWFSIGADVPFVAYQGFGRPTPAIPEEPRKAGVGDLRLAAKFRILNNEYEGLGLAVVPYVTVPLDDGQLHSAGRGNVGIEPRVALDYRTRRGLQVALNLSFLAFVDAERQRIPDVVLVSHQLRYGLGAYVPVSKIAGLFGELWGGVSVKAEPSGRRYAPFEGIVGVRGTWASGLVMSLGLGSGFLGDVGSPQLRVLASIGYLPTWSDPDYDKDGVLNEVDRCPRVKGPRENHGCPDTDTDKDGVVDRLDRCPTIPGPKENGGCPWPDTDKDGIIDPEDKCPTEPGPRENGGCPDKDTDGDGIVDRLDKCPTEPGVPPTGCPDRKYIVVTAEKIELKQKIFFATDKAKILPASFDLLNEVVAVLKERPTMKLRIEGHTDSRGSAAYNQKLSEARAASVREYLVTAGIDGSRLTSIGYGLTRPIGDNKTEDGREKNRRTEFFIVEQ